MRSALLVLLFGVAFVCGQQLIALDPLLDCVGSGHALLSLRRDYQEQLAETQKQIGFRQIRFHGVLDDDMSTYLNGEANMFNVFESYDNILSQGMRPIVELSFMPEDLALNSSETVFHYKGGTSAPANWTQWSIFIQQFGSLLVQRYGIDEVAQWKFEVWNEPNCGFLMPTDGSDNTGCCPTAECGPQALYFKLYSVTAQAIKSVSSRLQVGGPATAQTGWLPDFITYVTTNNLPCDFISTHLYPTDPLVPQTRDGFAQIIAEAGAKAAAVGLPLIVTEFNAGLGINAADGPYAAAFIVRQLAAFQQTNMTNLRTLSYWTFTDIFEEQGFISLPYSQQFGMRNIYNVPKPVYRIYEILAGIRALPDYSIASITTTGNVDVIALTAPSTFQSPTEPTCTRMMALATNFNVRGNSVSLATVEIVFSGLTDASQVPESASAQIIDDSNGYARPVWEAAGSPTYPGSKQVQAEMLASQVKSTTVSLVSRGNGQYSVRATLQPYGTIYVVFDYCGQLAQ